MKTVEDFQRQAQVQEIQRWPIHACSFCGYSCGYLIRGETVYYDSGCYCTMQEPTERTWQELADHYNRQTAAPVIVAMDAFWGFAAG